MAVMLVVQSGFMVVTEDVSLFFWIPCMMVAVFLMLFFIYVSCAIEVTDAVYFRVDCICCGRIHGVD